MCEALDDGAALQQLDGLRPAIGDYVVSPWFLHCVFYT
jgi:hypothetical protein